MRFVGLDVGERRIGVASSDLMGLIANAVGNVVRADNDLEGDLQKTADKIRELGGEAVVIGLPKNMNGTIGPRAESVMAFAEALKEKIDVPIHFWDERLSTVEAHKTMIDAGMSRSKRKNKVDSVAAVLILQGFLDFKGR
ncbi:MAG: Holliday junction resolvase RuvX [Clostridiales bacterium]|nr:Holliday junction resolvase RuvX [Clostridiales bacterium]